MKYRLTLLNCAIAGTVSAAGFSTNFDTGYNPNSDVAGQQGWVINDPTVDLSFFVTSNGSNAAAIGGYYDAPALTNVRLSHPLSIPFAQSSLGADVGVVPSTALYPGQDAFGLSVHSTGGANLFTIRFEPDTTVPVNPNVLNITWFSGTGIPFVTGWAIIYDGTYNVDVDFTASGADIQFTATVTGTNTETFSGTLPGLAGETWGSVGADFVVRGANPNAAGDNYLVFDNLSAIPEPSIGILVSGLAAGIVLRRRRNRAG